MEFIDNHPVVDHRVRFTDRVAITEDDAEHVKDGQVVVWIVQSVCQPPSYHSVDRESDERYRFNIQRVERAAVLSGPLRESALQYLDDPTQRQGYLAFEAPRYEIVLDGNPDPNGTNIEVEEIPEEELPVVAAIKEFGESVDHLFDAEPVRVVGSVYGPGPESETRRLLREWGDT